MGPELIATTFLSKETSSYSDYGIRRLCFLLLLGTQYCIFRMVLRRTASHAKGRYDALSDGLYIATTRMMVPQWISCSSSGWTALADALVFRNKDTSCSRVQEQLCLGSRSCATMAFEESIPQKLLGGTPAQRLLRDYYEQLAEQTQS